MADDVMHPLAGRGSFWLGGLALLLAVLMVIQLFLNHGLQAQIAGNQKLVLKEKAISTVDNSLVQLLAKSAYESHDADITALLARNGVTFREKNGAGTATSGAPSAAGGQ